MHWTLRRAWWLVPIGVAVALWLALWKLVEPYWPIP